MDSGVFLYVKIHLYVDFSRDKSLSETKANNAEKK